MASRMTAAAYQLSMTEAEMEDAIRKAAANQGGRVYHVRRSDQAPEMEHFPDLVVLLPGRSVVAFVELKSQKRAVTAGQHGVMAMLEQCRGCEAWIVRPAPRDGEVAYDDLMRWLGCQ